MPAATSTHSEAMQGLQEHLIVPVEDNAGRRYNLVYADNEYVQLVPYKASAICLALFSLLLVLSGGLLVIVSVWFPQLFTMIARRRLDKSQMKEADFMLAMIEEDGWSSKWIEVPVFHTKEAGSKLDWIWFEFKKNRYVFNHDKNEFERYLATIKEELAHIQARLITGLDSKAVEEAQRLHGPNVVDLDPPSIPMLLFTKVVHPYYLFQVFSAIVWFCEAYTVYAVVILVLSATSMAWEIYSEESNSRRLRSLVVSSERIEVTRTIRSSNGSDPVQTTMHINERDLVPGDIVVVGAGKIVADILLLSGNCVVDESSLTGEAIPISKEPATGAKDITEEVARVTLKSSFLHAGSTVTRIRDSSGMCKGVVLSTGFSTGKGELFRSIIFPKPLKFEFERDSYRYLAVLAVIAISAFIKRLADGSRTGKTFGHILVGSLDLITIAVPPALPLVLSTGVGFALQRLLKGGIFCVDAHRINSCGQLSCYCFDKTGTLTEDHLNLRGADIVSHATFQGVQTDIASLPQMFQLAMATCHGLTETDGELQGYSLEVDMIQATKFSLETLHDKSKGDFVALITSPSGDRYGVVQRFPFDPACQRCSVVIEHMATKKRFVIVKGSPEAVSEIAHGMPNDFYRKTLVYSSEGYYCIGFGVRELRQGEVVAIRSEADHDINFIGLSLFINDLKPESKGMIEELYTADIDVRMITGDHGLTAVHVARLVGMQLKPNVAIVNIFNGVTMYHCVDSIKDNGPQIVHAPVPRDPRSSRSVSIEDASANMKWQLFNSTNVTRVMADYDIALTGAALEVLRNECSDETMRQLVAHTYIFARIRPDKKTWIVEQLIDSGLVVGMCGDGTNDCGALKAAHVGLALSAAEASIVAPFTSKAKAITDVPVLIREGRCALTTSFLGFKYMVLYPIIQLAMASTLGQIDIVITNNQFIWDDLVIVLVLAMSMLYTRSSHKLTREKPPHTLFSLVIMASIIGQIGVFVAFFAGQVYLVHQQSWFCSSDDGATWLNETRADIAPTVSSDCAVYADVNGAVFSYEGTVIWLFSHMAYISVAAAFNIKDPFRQPFYTNKLYTTMFLVILGINLWFLLDNSGTINNAFQVMLVPTAYRIQMLLLFVGHFAASILWEMFATRCLPKQVESMALKRCHNSDKFTSS